MNYYEFVSALEHYYGNYDTFEKKTIITKYVMENIKESELDTLFKRIILKISSQYKTPPDVAMLSGLFQDRIDIQANEVWTEICRKVNAYRDVIFADSRVYLAFRNSIGTLNTFSLRERDDEVWMKKRFIDLYKSYLNNSVDDHIIPIMKGLSNWGNDPVMIGDETKCLELLNRSPTGDIEYELTKNFKMIGD